MDKYEKVYDFVIIGSGIGGLVSGLILSMEGHSVLILEKNHQIGGNLQVFSRDKCVFDTGVHYIGSLDNGENLSQFFKYLGILDGLKMQRMDEDCYDLIRFADGKEYKHAQGYDNFKKQLYESFPAEKKAIDAFCDKIREICTFFPLYNLEESRGADYYSNQEMLEMKAAEYIESITSDVRLQNVLAGSNPLYAGKKDKTPLYVHALILNSYISGSYRMVDGGAQIAKMLTMQIRKHGGELLKHQHVISANFDDQRSVTEVITKQGMAFRGKNFISNLHPAMTIDIFGESHFLKAYRNRINHIENTASSFIVHLSFHENTFPYLNYNIYDYECDDVWESIEYTQEDWPKAMFLCTPASSRNKEFAESMSVMTYMDYSEVSEWEGTYNTIAEKSERGERYEAFKRRKEEIIVEKLELKYPGIRKMIKGVYSSSPLTFKDYIGTKDGSMYGILKDANNIHASILNPRTRIPNLYLTGQNLIFHGILGATIGAFVTCFYFVDSKKILKKIKNS